MTISRIESDRRLNKLADFLDTVPVRRFNFSEWISDLWKGGSLKAPSCKATACALGWATAIPEFAKLGLYLFRSGDRSGQICLEGGGTDFDAGAILFGIDFNQSFFLFSPEAENYLPGFRWQTPDRNATPKQVARHIRRFIEARRVLEAEYEVEEVVVPAEQSLAERPARVIVEETVNA